MSGDCDAWPPHPYLAGPFPGANMSTPQNVPITYGNSVERPFPMPLGFPTSLTSCHIDTILSCPFCGYRDFGGIGTGMCCAEAREATRRAEEDAAVTLLEQRGYQVTRPKSVEPICG